MLRYLYDHFPKGITNQLKSSLNVDTVEDANRYTDEALLKIPGFGKMALQKLRNLQKAEIKQDLVAALLPSAHQIGEIVNLDLGCDHILKARVNRVSFYKSGIQYDLDVEITGSRWNSTPFWDRIHGVSGARVKKR